MPQLRSGKSTGAVSAILSPSTRSQQQSTEAQPAAYRCESPSPRFQTPRTPFQDPATRIQSPTVQNQPEALRTVRTKRVEMPKGWMIFKRKRCSAGDIGELGRQLDLTDTVGPASQETPRHNSCPPAIPPGPGLRHDHEVPALGQNTASIESETVEFLGDVSERETALAQTPDSYLHAVNDPQGRGFLVHVLRKWRGISTLCRRRGRDLIICSRRCYEALSTLQGFDQPNNTRPPAAALAGSILRALWAAARDIRLVFFVLLQSLWSLVRWPVYGFFAVWMCLQISAMSYTYTSNAFLSNFCQNDLPLVRDWICSSWDKRVEPNQQNSSIENLNQPFESIFHSSGKTMSYELPHHIVQYGTTVRSFRASLPKSGYSPDDQRFFRHKFTEFIDQSSSTVTDAQLFHTHMIGTINRHILGTKYVAQRVNNSRLLIPTTVPISGLLAQGIVWFGARHMLYLPAGIEPFQQASLQVYKVQAMMLLEEHVRMIGERLDEDIHRIVELQRALLGLGELSEEIATHIARCKYSNSKDANARGKKKLLWFREMAFGQDYQDYEIDQRRKWLTIMDPVFHDATTFLNHAAHQFTVVRLSCQSLQERLADKAGAAEDGADVPEWVTQQVRELTVGMEELEDQLTAFKQEQLRFDRRVFKRADAGYE
ncbi:MAG: hypothetical protein Q9201_002967 [Fulgogasparrea decipioides]